MALTLTVEVEAGRSVTVDVGAVTGWDAVSYERVVGGALEARIAEAIARRNATTLADKALVLWLWHRQNVDPMASFAEVTATLRMLDEDDLEPPDAGVREPVEPAPDTPPVVVTIDEPAAVPG